MPNYAAIQASMDDIRERELRPYFEKGNLMARDLYADLLLPWTVSPPVEEFEKETFYRKEYGPEFGNSEEYIAGSTMQLDLDSMEKILGTSSPVQRWRDAHPDAVGTDKDVIKMIRNEVERLLHEAGVEKGKEVVTGSLRAVLMIFKRKA
jgi:trans-aconitate 3-methyltransferase